MDTIPYRADEAELKAKFLEFLLKRAVINRRSIVASEYRVDGATRRADLAIFTSHSFIGIEVKSEFDTLARLTAQADAYLRVFDQVMVLVADKHAEAAERILSPAVGLFTIDIHGLISERRAPAKEDDQAFDAVEASKSALVGTLPKTTLMKILNSPQGRHSRRDLMDASKLLSRDVLRQYLISEFKQRYVHTSSSFWALVPRSKRISSSLLTVLSRFASSRNQPNDWEMEQRLRWERWVANRQSQRQPNP